MKRGLYSVLVLVCLLGSSALGQSSGRVVKAHPEQDGYRVKRGSLVQAAIVLDIDSGFHINSSRPLDKLLIATALKIAPEAGLSAGRVVYPRAKLQKFSFSEKPMSVYEGRAVFKLSIRALPAASTGKHNLQGKLTVQACNNEQCLRPQTIDVEIPVEVTD